MSFFNNKCKKYPSKRLTFRNSQANPIVNQTKSNVFDNITASSANIDYLSSELISSPSASIANVSMTYDSVTDTTYLQTNNNLVVKQTDGPNSITIRPNGEVVIATDLIVNRITGLDGQFSGDIEATNVNLLGDLTATNGYLTSNLRVDGNVDASNIRATALDAVDITTINLGAAAITATDGLYENNLAVTNNLTIGGIMETAQISSLADLNIVLPIGNSLNVPNIRYIIDSSNISVIDAVAMKSAKIFVTTRNILLQPDASSDGIEIIIYNQNRIDITVRGSNLVTIIASRTAKKFVYIDVVRSWSIV